MHVLLINVYLLCCRFCAGAWVKRSQRSNNNADLVYQLHRNGIASIIDMICGCRFDMSTTKVVDTFYQYKISCGGKLHRFDVHWNDTTASDYYDQMHFSFALALNTKLSYDFTGGFFNLHTNLF